MGAQTMRMPRRAATVMAAAVVGAVALAGCDSEETPTTSPSPTASSASPSPSASSPSPTPSPSPTSDIPAAARENTDAGAEAFVKYFVDQSALAWTTPDADLVTRLSDSGCESCAMLASTANDLEAKGHRYATAPIEVVSVEALAGDADRRNVAASIEQFEVNVIDESGSVVSSDRADDLERTFLLFWREGTWVVGGIA